MTNIASLADRELQVADLYALARRDFFTFVELAFPILHPGTIWATEIARSVRSSSQQSASVNGHLDN
jgi:hypothetical protein